MTETSQSTTDHRSAGNREANGPSWRGVAGRVLSEHSMSALRWFTAAVCLALFVYYIAVTWHWGIIGDGATMHYVIFLTQQGKLPYSEITDMNMPGTYLTEAAAMLVFGASDLAWRCYEIFLLAAMTLGGAILGGRRRWLAGIFAGAFFIAMHGADGPQYAVERDELMGVLLVCAGASLVLAVRRREAWLGLPMGVLAGLATSIKPTALLIDVALLALLIFELRRRKQPVARYIVYCVTGDLVVLAAVLVYLWHYHALGAFLFTMRTVLPQYVASTPHSFGFLWSHFWPEYLPRVFPFALAAIVLGKTRATLERWLLVLGAAFGALSYFAQGKGYVHHRYIFVMFLVLWIGFELSEAMRREGLWSRAVGAAGVIVLLLLVLPHYVRIMQREHRPTGTLGNAGVPGAVLTTALVRDLTDLGGDRLQGRVVCLDLWNSCLDTLYRLRLVENTSYTGDMMLFSPTDTPLARYYRDRFMSLQLSNPADVVVLNNQWYLEGRSDFHKLDTWPAYKVWLEANYINVKERRVPGETDTQAYRLLLRKGSDVLAYEQTHPLP